ncbi:hypothetical protein HY408_01205 [Candidatus Gottesmanbacteria bacterium]|nr:hypothetical protein [Candidatus Gottesmanbacteria bacterium]
MTYLVKLIRSSVILGSPWRSNILLHSSSLVLISLPQDAEGRVVIVSLPSDAYINVPYGYGKYRIAAVKKLGKLDKKPELLKDAAEDLFSLPVDGWVDSGDVQITPESSNPELVLTLKNYFLSSLVPFTEVQSNLSSLDRLQVALALWGIKSEKISLFNFSVDSSIMQKSRLPDETEINTVSPEMLYLLLTQEFEDADIRKQGLRVEVNNTTTIPKIGEKFARIVSQVGGNVIGVNNRLKNETRCTVEAPESYQKEKLVLFLTQKIGCTLTRSTGVHSADITIFVGASYAERWREE